MNKLLLLLLASTLTACAADATDDEPREEETSQAREPLMIGPSTGVERTCPDFQYWCVARGMCIGTDKVCYDPNKQIFAY